MKILFLQTTAITNSKVAYQWLCSAWAMAAADHEVDLAFAGSSIYHLSTQHAHQDEYYAEYIKGLQNSALYDIHQVYVQSCALTKCALSTKELTLPTKCIDTRDWRELLQAYCHIISY